MKMLKKLALVSAVSMISAGAFAMEAMDDESMAATTGQDGITVLVSPGNMTNQKLQDLGVSNKTINAIGAYSSGTDATAGTYNAGTGLFDAAAADDLSKGLSISKIIIHDDDGVTAAAGAVGGYLVGKTTNSGALVIGGANAADSTVVFAKGDSPISIKLDMVGNVDGTAGADKPMLNIAITTPTLGIKTGNIYVANSNSSEAGFDADGIASALPVNVTQVDGTAATGDTKILSGLEIIIGGSTTVIQLGNEAQGAMIKANTQLVGGLTINNFELFDANGLGNVLDVGSIQVGSLVMKDNGGTDLNVNVSINASGGVANPTVGEGLYITMTQFGHATNGADLSLNNVAIGKTVANGGAAIIGDVQLIGLNLAGTTMIIRGH